MSDFRPKQGQMILVGEVKGCWMSAPMVFVCLHQGGWLCQYDQDEDRFKVWSYAEPLPAEPDPTLFTHETWPKQVVWTRSAISLQRPSMVIGFTDLGIQSGNQTYTFEDMVNGRLMSLDFCATWKPCHYVPEE